jgi:hypothetical protein
MRRQAPPVRRGMISQVTSRPATRTDTQSPALQVADSRDLIRVQGARVNNLKDISLEIPKRQAGTADEFVSFLDQKYFVELLQLVGKDAEWHYYQGGRHTLVLDPAKKDDAIRRIIDFFTRRLKGRHVVITHHLSIKLALWPRDRILAVWVHSK